MALFSDQQVCIQEPLQQFNYGLLLLTPKERKEIKLFTRENSQQAKEEQEIFLAFLLIITTTSMKSKLAENYN